MKWWRIYVYQQVQFWGYQPFVTSHDFHTREEARIAAREWRTTGHHVDIVHEG